MKYECKYCGSEQTRNVIQDMINDFVANGRKYIDSSGNEVGFKEISWCKCKESILRRQDVRDEL